MTVLSFDIGIKNLAWCITNTADELEIRGWGNYNLLQDENQQTTAAPTCAHCQAKAKYVSTHGLSCARHVPAAAPILKDLSGNVLAKVPGAPVLKAILMQKGIKVPKGKDAMVTAIKAVASIPVTKVKVPHAAAINVSEIHDSIRTFVRTQIAPFFPDLTDVRLENQPVLKNPVMKTVQILLFATLRDCILETGRASPPFKLVHAGMKVKGKETGTAGYAARKKGSEDRTVERLKAPKMANAAHWLAFFQAHKKRNDLADAFCMCLDAVATSAVNAA
jgi:hypothetical protein